MRASHGMRASIVGQIIDIYRSSNQGSICASDTHAFYWTMVPSYGSQGWKPFQNDIFGGMSL